MNFNKPVSVRSAIYLRIFRKESEVETITGSTSDFYSGGSSGFSLNSNSGPDESHQWTVSPALIIHRLADNPNDRPD